MSTTWSQQIGRELWRQRKRAGLSNNSLGQKTKEVGRPVHRVAIAKAETGDRDLTVLEITGLAAALQVPPLALLFPDVRETVELFPGRPVNGMDALGWFTGTGDSPDQDSSSMQLALALVTTEKTLNIQRHNLFQAERGPEVLDMSEQMKAYEAKNVERAREQIELLEAERTRLLSLYSRLVDGEFDA